MPIVHILDIPPQRFPPGHVSSGVETKNS